MGAAAEASKIISPLPNIITEPHSEVTSRTSKIVILLVLVLVLFCRLPLCQGNDTTDIKLSLPLLSPYPSSYPSLFSFIVQKNTHSWSETVSSFLE